MTLVKDFLNYRVFTNQVESDVYIVTFDSWDPKHSHVVDGKYPDIPESTYITRRNMNHIGVQTKRNDWYLREGIDDVLKYIRSVVPSNGILITYGGSMGGTAAFFFAHKLGANFFIVTSPQASIEVAIMRNFSDTRWRLESEAFGELSSHYFPSDQDKIPGVVFVDATHDIDIKHACLVAKSSNVSLVYTHGGWHNSAVVVNRAYGIGQFIKEISECLLLRSSVSAVIGKVKKAIESGYATEFAKGPEHALKLIAQYGVSYARRHVVFKYVLNVFEKNLCLYSGIIVNLLSVSDDEKRAAQETFLKHGFLGLAQDAVRPMNLSDFYTMDKSDLYRENAFFLGADVFRDEAIRLEKKGDFNSAYSCMLIAKELRPSGKQINSKLEMYKSILEID